LWGHIGNNAETAEKQKLNRLTSWALFHSQFEAMTRHRKWAPGIKATHLLAACKAELQMSSTESLRKRRKKKV
jgi:hypothetical protein